MNYAEEYNAKIDYIKDSFLDTDWFVEKTGSIIKIRFDGTKSFKDVLVDLMFIPKKVKLFKDYSLKFHKGFVDAYWSVRSKLLDKCYNLYKYGDAFLIEGHSLGGALATICAEDIAYHFNTKPTLITWGCPRACANKKTIKNITSHLNMADSRFFSNGSDLIPCLPFWNPKLPYTHIGKKFNFVKGLLDMVKAKFDYHCGYGDPIIYVSDKLGDLC